MREVWYGAREHPGSARSRLSKGQKPRRGTPDWWWAEASIWTERMVSALGNGVKGGKWFSLIDKVVRPTTLEAAWRNVARNKGAAGWTARASSGSQRSRNDICMSFMTILKAGSYRPSPVKRVEIPKGDGRTRPLGIPTVKDRIVQTALKMVIEPIFEVQFRPGATASVRDGAARTRCGKSIGWHERRLHLSWWTPTSKSYFDTIPHDRLMALVETSISDGRVLSLIQSFLQQDIMKGMERWPPTSGHAARRGDLAAAGQPVSAPARPSHGAERTTDGALCR